MKIVKHETLGQRIERLRQSLGALQYAWGKADTLVDFRSIEKLNEEISKHQDMIKSIIFLYEYTTGRKYETEEK